MSLTASLIIAYAIIIAFKYFAGKKQRQIDRMAKESLKIGAGIGRR